MTEWSDPRRVPRGFEKQFHEARRGVVTPEGIQINLFTLCQIGGAYDLLALEVERQHLAVLAPWRLDSKAPRVLDYLRARAVRDSSTSETRNTNA